MRRPVSLLAALATALLAFPAIAQSQPTLVTASLAISWTAPTIDSTGAVLTSVEAVTSYQIYISGSTTMPSTPTATVAPATTGGVVPTSATESISTGVGSTSYVSVAACNAFGCGALSSPTAITVSGSAPGVPTNVKITATIT